MFPTGSIRTFVIRAVESLGRQAAVIIDDQSSRATSRFIIGSRCNRLDQKIRGPLGIRYYKSQKHLGSLPRKS